MLRVRSSGLDLAIMPSILTMPCWNLDYMRVTDTTRSAWIIREMTGKYDHVEGKVAFERCCGLSQSLLLLSSSFYLDNQQCRMGIDVGLRYWVGTSQCLHRMNIMWRGG